MIKLKLMDLNGNDILDFAIKLKRKRRKKHSSNYLTGFVRKTLTEEKLFLIF